jgi:hypothetical protein
MPRDDFSEEVKTVIAKRVSYLCSRPDCRAVTIGPHNDPAKTVNVGVAAHITAASPGGPRYDRSLSSAERRHADNAIWLCQNCAKLIDSDGSRFTVAVLRHWKRNAEEEARALMGRMTTPQSQNLQAKCRQYLPHLPAAQKKILAQLDEKPVELKSTDTIIRALEQQKFIELVIETDAYKGLYRLSNDIAPIIKSYFAEERRQRLSACLEDAGEDEREFLMLFASPSSAGPGHPEHPFMEYRVYMAGKRLADEGVFIKEASKPSTERMRLAPDAILIVEERIIKGKVQRDSITLDWNNIAASSMGGSGAPAHTWTRTF